MRQPEKGLPGFTAPGFPEKQEVAEGEELDAVAGPGGAGRGARRGGGLKGVSSY